MPFNVDFNWASQAIIETVAVPFPSLETPPGVVVADPPIPQLESKRSGPVTVTMFGNGRWNRDTSYRFNAGCNDDRGVAAKVDDVGELSLAEAERLEEWFRKRYPGSKPNVLKTGGKWNFTLVRNGAVFNFHVSARGAHG
ncbi:MULTISPECIES: hypothetical protein [Micromonospora]|uniref:Uncharacterized protein n=1 Tax=Micromonospora profundi TaxID=1420889 RepID=A0AAJ6HT69_9ACTN|nr:MULTISPECIES: hypothetical protein [Micromonospora]NJC11575.1 hypothetical protein [Micromonospora profundi]WLS43479.1 hypothetical protein Q3V37_18945 [Micromonospora profundi]